MKDNPPAKADAPMVAKLKRLGIVPGKSFDIAKLDPTIAKGLDGVPKPGVREDHGPLQECRHRQERMDVHD